MNHKNVSWVGKEQARKRPTKREGRADHGVENGLKRRRLVALSSLSIFRFLLSIEILRKGQDGRRSRGD